MELPDRETPTDMGFAGQMNGHPGIVVTREVRWFVAGPLPEDVLAWFTSGPVDLVEERRTDRYDPRSARSGIGLKYRAGTTFDAKYLLSEEAEQRLAEGVVGIVGDWVKVSRPIRDHDVLGPALVAVDKHLRTRRYPMVGDAAGCEVELATVSTGPANAWTLCFETYGPADHRGAALAHGIARCFEDTPLPDQLRFESQCSCAYPTWIADRCAVA